MFRRRPAHDADLEWVYGAAVRAAVDHTAAERAVVLALAQTDEASLNGNRRRALMIAAVRAAVATAPAASLAHLPDDERETLALARVLSLGVDEIAGVVGCEPREVKARMRSGLVRLSGVS